jgi:hypothetical protein
MRPPWLLTVTAVTQLQEHSIMKISIRSVVRSLVYASLATALSGAFVWLTLGSTPQYDDPAQLFAQSAWYSQPIAPRHDSI